MTFQESDTPQTIKVDRILNVKLRWTNVRGAHSRGRRETREMSRTSDDDVTRELESIANNNHDAGGGGDDHDRKNEDVLVEAIEDEKERDDDEKENDRETSEENSSDGDDMDEDADVVGHDEDDEFVPDEDEAM